MPWLLNYNLCVSTANQQYYEKSAAQYKEVNICFVNHIVYNKIIFIDTGI
jgi:hypothetical protein